MIIFVYSYNDNNSEEDVDLYFKALLETLSSTCLRFVQDQTHIQQAHSQNSIN